MDLKSGILDIREGGFGGGGYNFETGIEIEVIIETVTVQLNCDTGQPSLPLHCFAFKLFRFVRALMIEGVRTAQCTWLRCFPSECSKL